MVNKYISTLIITVIYLAGFCSGVFASTLDTLIIQSDSLKNNKTYDINEWSFLSGNDSLSFFERNSDSSFILLNSLSLKDSNENYLWKGAGWFSKTIQIDSNLINKSIALLLRHNGASRIYLGNKLIKSFGKIEISSDTSYNPKNIPFVINFGDSLYYDLTILYSNQNSFNDSSNYALWYDETGFSARIRDVNSSFERVRINSFINSSVNVGIFGLFLSLGILYLLLFVFYSRKKENLFYALFTLSLGFAIFLGHLSQLFHAESFWELAFRTLPGILLGFVFLFYLMFLYSIFYKKFPKLVYILILVTIALAVTFSFGSNNETASYILFGQILVVAFEGIRVIIIALKRKKENARIIGAGVLCFGAFIFFLFAINMFSLQLPEMLAFGLVFMGVFSLPVSMSIYLAKDIADTNKHLELQIEAVRDLSDREIENEKKNAELQIQREKEEAAKKEAELRAEAAELQAKAAEAQAKVIQAENERKTKELEEARQLQLSMLPKTLPDLPHLDIAVYMQTATEVGGDYYDFHVGLDGTLTVAIGDATGHGLNAGTMVTATKSLFNTHAGNDDILATFSEITRVIKGMKFRFLSMCLCLIKIKGNYLTMSSAGIPPALIFRAETGDIDEILLRGMPLGVKQDFPYSIKNTLLNSGDTILLMSDGFPELFNERKEMLGYDKMKNIFSETAENSPEEIITHLKNRAIEWSNDRVPDDDVTFVVIKMK